MLPRVELPAWPDGKIGLRTRWGGQRSLILVAHPGASPLHGGVEAYLMCLQAWSEHAPEFNSLDYDVALLSAEGLIEQQWLQWARRNVVVLSDERMELADALGLQTIESPDGAAFEAATVIIQLGEVTQVFDPSPTPSEDVQTVLRFVRAVAG